jgi:hypothetical protein
LIENQLEEDIHLEYKREIIKNNKIAKIFSAMANSDGGFVFFGIEEEDNKPSGLNPIDIAKIREKLDMIARTGITPPLYIRLHPIDVQVKEQKGQVFMVYIPKKYPLLHFAKKDHRFYKRSESNSIPMEGHEIREAYRIYNEREHESNTIIEATEQQFFDKIDPHDIDIRILVKPDEFGSKFFELEQNLFKFLTENIPYIPKHRYLPLFFHNMRGMSNNIGPDYYFFKPDDPHLTTAMFKTNGIVLLDIHFDILREPNIVISKRKGQISEESLDILLISHCIVTLLEYLEIFYHKINYWGEISIILKISNIKCWRYQGRDFADQEFQPIILHHSVNNLASEKLTILKKLMSPLLNGFGVRENDKDYLFHMSI